MALDFRPARPEDVDVAVPLIYASGPEQFDYVFSASHAGQALDFLRFAFVSGRGRFAWRNTTVACVADRVVGVGTAYGPDTNVRYFFEDGWLIARDYGIHAPSTMLRGLLAEQVIVPPKRGEWMVAHLAMAPAERGHGLGARMVHHLMEQGRRAGARDAVLDVSVENARAEALYRRLGFALVVERASTRSSRFGRLMNHRRMALALDQRHT
jgi:ribosomal protein S18 acetylase RimI-like enzyme